MRVEGKKRNGPGSSTQIETTEQYYKFIQSYPNIKMKADRKQTAVKLTTSKIGTHSITNYGKKCLHQVVAPSRTSQEL